MGNNTDYSDRFREFTPPQAEKVARMALKRMTDNFDELTSVELRELSETIINMVNIRDIVEHG